MLIVAAPATAQKQATRAFDALFTDITAAAGIDTSNAYSWGSSWSDANGDGYPDLFLSNHFRIKDENQPVFYFSNGDGTFTLDSVPGFLQAIDMHGAGWFDADNDGDQDLLVTTGRAGRNLFLINDGSGGYLDRAVSLGLDVPNARGRTPLFLDFDRNGVLDVITTAGPPLTASQLPTTLSLQNDGCIPSCYTNIPDSLDGILGSLSSTEALLVDWNADEQLEPFVVTPGTQPWFAMGCFPLLARGGTEISKTIEVLSGDFNGDLRPDLYYIRNDEGQSGVTTSYPINYPFYFGIGLIDPNTVEVLEPSTAGTASIMPGGVLTYAPDSGFVGLDSLLVGYCDSAGNCLNRVALFDIRDSAFVPENGMISALSGETSLLDIPKWIHPFRAHLRAGFQPQHTAHLIKIKTPSDTLYMGIDKLELDASQVFFGQNGTHPESAATFFAHSADTTFHGLLPFTPGAELQLLVGYDTLTEEWTMGLNTDRAGGLLVFSMFSGKEATITEYIGFDSLPIEYGDRLLVQQASGWQDATAAANLAASNRAVAGVALDFDNDMDLDIYLSNGISGRNDPNTLLANQGDGSFIPVALAGGAQGKTIGSAGPVTTADIDRDGFLDLFVENGRDPANEKKGPYQLFQNNGNDNHWLGIDLVGTQSNRDGIGAIAKLYAGGIGQVRYADGGMHRYSQNDKTLHFGLGVHTAVDSLVITWPSGVIQRESVAAVDQYITVIEPDSGSVACFGPGGMLDVLTANSVFLAWRPVPCALGFQVELREADSLEWSVMQIPDTVIAVSIGNLTLGRQYEWRVRTRCGDGQLGGYGKTKFFSLPPPCTAPDTVTTQFIGDTVKLTWTAVPTAIGYGLHYRRDVDTAFRLRRIAENSFALRSGSLSIGTTYSYFIQPFCSFGGLGDSSEIQSFSVPSARILLSDAELDLRPNPADHEILLNWAGDAESGAEMDVSWEAMDVTGRIHHKGILQVPGSLRTKDWVEGWHAIHWKAITGRSSGIKRILIRH